MKFNSILLLLPLALSTQYCAAKEPNFILIYTDDKYGCPSANFQKRWETSENMDFHAVFKSMAIAEDSV